MDRDFSEAYRELNRRIVNLLDSFSALSALSSLNLSNVDETKMIRDALKGLMENLDIERCSVFLLRDGELVNCTGLDWDDLESCEDAEFTKHHVSCNFTVSIGEGIMGLAVQHKSLQHCHDCSANSHYKNVSGQNIGSLISVPIFQFGGEVLGVLNISHTTPHFFNEWHERFLVVYCHCLGQLLSNYRLFNHMEQEIEKHAAQLFHSQKIEAVGQLAGGVAHDFNNIITAISGYAHLVFMKMSENDPLKRYIEQIIASSDRAANLTQSLLAFSRKQVIHPEPINLNKLIKGLETLLVPLIGEDINLKTDVPEQELFIMAGSGQFEQIIMNLATNARDAMPAGGELTITARLEDIDDHFIESNGFGRPGKYVHISVSDTGSGMDESIRNKIFEPFFTTKEVGKGTGLGLSIAYGIISQQHGYIDVRSIIGKGTTFNIYYPTLDKISGEIRPKSAAALLAGTETLLIAEDDENIRNLNATFLQELGYLVLTAADGNDALEKFEEHKNRIDIVILDVVMPGKNGKEVYDRIIEIRPEMKVLFTSGYTSDIISRKGISSNEFDFLEKPHPPAVLSRKLRQMLDKN